MLFHLYVFLGDGNTPYCQKESIDYTTDKQKVLEHLRKNWQQEYQNWYATPCVEVFHKYLDTYQEDKFLKYLEEHKQ